jgi:hypothetical protein
VSPDVILVKSLIRKARAMPNGSPAAWIQRKKAHFAFAPRREKKIFDNPASDISNFRPRLRDWTTIGLQPCR